MFEYFYEEKTQTIGFEELKYTFACLGEKVSDYEVSKMIIFADKNRDGKLDFSEFCKVIKEM
jgi:Ca2+-binding EF-hand superfamily protein